ncbi:MAG: hypothetical protein V9H69_17805 [Anaerolineae bacterium]
MYSEVVERRPLQQAQDGFFGFPWSATNRRKRSSGRSQVAVSARNLKGSTHFEHIRFTSSDVRTLSLSNKSFYLIERKNREDLITPDVGILIEVERAGQQDKKREI